MAIEEIKVAKCDRCNESIDLNNHYINAMTYGVTLHTSCWNNLTGIQLAKLLRLDEIVHIRNEDWSTAQKIIYVS